jgi:hypothetical protein
LLKDPITGAVVSRLEAPASGFTSGLRFTPDAGRLAVVSLDGSITLWNPKEAEPLLVVSGCGPEPQAFDNFDINGERLVCAGSDGVIHTWDVRLKNYPGARQLAESQLRQRFLVAEVVRQIGNDSTIGEPLRNAAVAEARLLHNDLAGLAVWVGSLIGDPSPRKEDCLLAYDRMQAVVPHLPYPDNLLFSDVMGGLLYRLGRYKEALAVLSPNPIDNLAGADSRATNRAAFLAMTFHQVGKSSEARERLQALAASSPALSERLLREAEALIGGSAGSVRTQGEHR